MTHTQSRVAAAELRRSEERLRSAVENAGMGIWELDITTGQGSWSDIARQQLGLKSDAPSTFDVFMACVHPEDRDRVSRAVAGLHQGGTYGVEFRVVGPDGDVRHLASVARLYRDRVGQPPRILGTIVDVTHQKRAEAALQASESRLRAIVAAEPECVKLLDVHGRLLEMNPAGLTMLEADSLEHVLGAQASAMVVPEHRAAFDAMTAAAFAGQPAKGEFEIVGLRGTRRWMESSMVPLRDEREDIVAALALSRDVSDRKAAESALRASEQRLHSVLDHAPIVLFATDRDGVFTLSRGSALAAIGFEPDGVVGQSIFEVFGELPTVVHQMRRALAGEMVTEQIAFAERVFECTCTPMFADGVSLVGVTGVAIDITERLRAEGQLAHQSKTLAEQAALLHLTHDAIVVWELQTGAIRFWNRGAEELYGWSSDEVVGRTPEAVLHTEFPRPLSEINAELVGNQRWEGELVHTRRDGSRVAVSSRWALQFDAQGRPRAVLAINTDITEQRRVEDAVRKLEEQNRLLIDNANDVVIAYDMRGKLTFVNRRWESLTGYSTEAALDMSITDVLHPEDRDAVLDNLRRRLAGEDIPINYPMRIVRIDGEVRWVEANVSVIRRNQEVLGLQAFVRDVTERFRAEEERQRLAAIVQSSHDAIVSWTLDGTISSWNRGAEHLYGYAAHEAIGQPLRLLVPVDHADSIKDIVAAATSGKDLEIHETVRQHKSGKLVDVSIAASAIRDHTGRVVGAATIARDIGERKRAEQALAHQARHDALTGLPNRTLLRERLDAALASLTVDGTPLALLLLDLDRFKDVNDTLGHGVGDSVLQQVAQRLRHALRSDDTIARLGGDEFGVLLPATRAATALQLAGRLRAALARPVEIDGIRLDIGASIGVALGPEHGHDTATLLRRADVAMYAAKRSGKAVMLYRSELDRDNVDRLQLTTELRHAIEHGQLVLHYQPKIEVASGQVVGVEALVRWSHRRRGMLGPDQFIPLAEQSGLIEPLTRWVLSTARRQQAEWQMAGLRLTMAVNLSAHSLREPKMVATIRDVLAFHPEAICGLELELTESTLMTDPDHAAGLLAELRALGVRTSVDDFGTGYSSLAYLKRLPLDALKIDRCFVREMAVDDRDRALVKATIDLAHNLGLRVVAEGVEDAAALDLLGTLGCDLAQGYHISRPVPAAELSRWLVGMAGNGRAVRGPAIVAHDLDASSRLAA